MSIKTPEAARKLNVQYARLFSLIRRGLIPAPAKDSSGDYWWSEEDVERAREALARPRSRKSVPAA